MPAAQTAAEAPPDPLVRVAAKTKKMRKGSRVTGEEDLDLDLVGDDEDEVKKRDLVADDDDDDNGDNDDDGDDRSPDDNAHVASADGARCEDLPPSAWTPRMICGGGARTYTPQDALRRESEDARGRERAIVMRCFQNAGSSSDEARNGLETCIEATLLRGRFVAVAASWWAEWKLWSGFGAGDGKPAHDKRPGPLRLAGQGSGVVSGVVSIDYAWVPEEAWRALSAWYPAASVEGGASSAPRGRPMFYKPQGPAEMSANHARLRSGKGRRSSSIYEAFNLPKDPAHWDAQWPDFAACEVRSGPEGGTDCLSCCKANATKVCGACRRARYCSQDCQASAWRFHKKRCSPNAEEGQRRGLVGIRNLGNTCYMNSTLQCLSNCWPLTRYFLSNRFKQDRNLNSVLGTGARFAMVWDALVKELWFGASSPVTPAVMKRAIGTLPGSGNQFAGFMQHDAQELLIFLLDTLHEDLNLVHTKPYFAEVDNVSDPPRRIADLAAESWANHLQREHSMVTHLFQGQLHNTVACPRCKFESHTFTPFMFLPLAIPVDRDRIIMVTVVRQTITKAGTLAFSRVRYAVGVKAPDQCGHVKIKLADLSGVPPSRQLLVQLRDHCVVRNFEDHEHVRPLLSADCDLYMYELAEPWLLDPKGAPRPACAGPETARDPVYEIFLLHKTGGAAEAPTMGLPLLLRVSASRTCLQVRMAISRLLRLLSTGRDTRDTSVLEREGRALQLRFVDLSGTEVAVEGLEGQPGLDAGAKDTPQAVDTPEETAAADSETGQEAKAETLSHTFLSEFPAHEDRSVGACVVEPFFVLAAIWCDASQATPRVRKTKKDRKRAARKKKAVVAYAEAPAALTVQHESARAHEASYQARIAAQQSLGGEVYTLHECLEFFSNRERLGTGNAWSCPKCKTAQEADKTMRIIRLPEVLIFCLKRFEPRSHRKIMSLVDFPREALDMAPFLAEFGGDKEKEDTVFDLFAVTNHIGTTGMGHYTAHVARQAPEDAGVVRWYLCDDSRITAVPASSVVSSSAYCLYYKRRRQQPER